MQVIPAIDLYNGKCVRLHKGDYDAITVYNESPIEQAQIFQDAGFDHIHIVDLNGAKEGRFVNLPHIKQIIKELGISVQTGGGIRAYDDCEYLLREGISKVICSSMAVRNEEDWVKLLHNHPKKSILGMDLKDGKIAYAGWLETAAESVDSFVNRMLDEGLQEILCTDISKDGTLSGPNQELYEELKAKFPTIRLIASGGVSNIDDLKRLSAASIDAVVVGKAYYEGRINLEEMYALNY
ncbi:MAG: 1-(5-phosphoribosyl)-5-[(5-phosphoribosylamino)methylideneamino]imidazole-4-carboxamide isomerase [Balneolaceae bacterium]|nr:1-(5-phosphoribosyl)-5-[(5-phosphoribosylamino)methylideneamino]imidazole-4-carboxamide isomerase [Balneolaceae bacterium]